MPVYLPASRTPWPPTVTRSSPASSRISTTPTCCWVRVSANKKSRLTGTCRPPPPPPRAWRVSQRGTKTSARTWNGLMCHPRRPWRRRPHRSARCRRRPHRQNDHGCSPARRKGGAAWRHLDACRGSQHATVELPGREGASEENRRLSSHGLRPAAGPLQRPAFLLNLNAEGKNRTNRNEVPERRELPG